MATRQSVKQCIEQCEMALEIAMHEYKDASAQEHYNDVGFSQSQSVLEEAYSQIEDLARSANAEQREELQRMRRQIAQMQNQMVLIKH
ncbi:polyhydroxyalkanoate synthesis regulator phasin [Bacillus ectoiniformans]|uniref:YtzC family protein n=1 Tax=Bacillus ectoiniformans TaxID=1494429 RepID=UPI001958F1D0|nr:YtzC family protein [Bacillus ectoiniformans]MBM7648063.1 polyhydroxyalkanoate synthesis regulator phasin [Bacillus ectoiniformans]